MSRFSEDENIGPQFHCNSEMGSPDYLSSHYHDNGGKSNLGVEIFEGIKRTEVWLNRSQVKDLMVVLGYFLHETEDEEEE